MQSVTCNDCYRHIWNCQTWKATTLPMWTPDELAAGVEKGLCAEVLHYLCIFFYIIRLHTLTVQYIYIYTYIHIYIQIYTSYMYMCM